MQPRRQSRRAPKPFSGGPERYVLALALLVPLAMIALGMAQLPSSGLAAPSSLLHDEAGMGLISRRRVSTQPEPPPTLVAPTATPKPTATPVPPTPDPRATATPRKAGSYVVQPGDELKQIAAQYNVSIFKIIALNDIPDPDSLKVGQELRIPADGQQD